MARDLERELLSLDVGLLRLELGAQLGLDGADGVLVGDLDRVQVGEQVVDLLGGEGAAARSAPNGWYNTRPEVGRSTVPMTAMSVLLPAPLAP